MSTLQPTHIDYLPVSLVAEMVYCPRSFYYRFVEQWEEVVSAEMVRGTLEEEKRQGRETLTRETGRLV
ncbi:MAG: hypothetical protein NZT92_23480, partial [Abditibacteriales bacterium]|nr:hypothetical protein [Abditibacteriales bacterium]